jgi:hypothetical protein
MRAIHFPQSNKTYVKPPSMTDEECYPVSVYEHKDAEGNIEFINTVWQPNKEDIEAINAGRPVVMNMRAGFLIPHALYTCDENGNINE